MRDFICVSTVVDVAGALAVHSSVPGNTLKDFIDYAKSRPGKLNYGAAAASSAQGLTMEYLKFKTGIDIQQIAYKGGAGPATTALLSGEVIGVAGDHRVVRAAREKRARQGAGGGRAETRRRAARGADLPRTRLQRTDDRFVAGRLCAGRRRRRRS